MKVLAVFNSKGGSGKSTIAMHVAVAAAETLNVVILDADINATTTAWRQARNVEKPAVEATSATNLRADIARMRKAGVDLVVLDCPPSITASSSLIVAQSDFVLVPVQPTMPDIAGCFNATRIIDSQSKPYAFIMNRCPPPSKEVRDTLDALGQSGEVCPVLIGDRIAFSRALASGLAVTEYEMTGKANAEIVDACAWILNRIGASNGKN